MYLCILKKSKKKIKTKNHTKNKNKTKNHAICILLICILYATHVLCGLINYYFVVFESIERKKSYHWYVFISQFWIKQLNIVICLKVCIVGFPSYFQKLNKFDLYYYYYYYYFLVFINFCSYFFSWNYKKKLWCLKRRPLSSSTQNSVLLIEWKGFSFVILLSWCFIKSLLILTFFIFITFGLNRSIKN